MPKLEYRQCGNVSIFPIEIQLQWIERESIRILKRSEELLRHATSDKNTKESVGIIQRPKG